MLPPPKRPSAKSAAGRSTGMYPFATTRSTATSAGRSYVDDGRKVAVDLFAGAGGFSTAAENIGFTVLAACENNLHASKTYRRNFSTDRENPVRLFAEDIRHIVPEEMRKELGIPPRRCDLILGGPPCQGFTTHRPENRVSSDSRNSLLLRYFDFVSEFAPKFFLVENVPGLIRPHHRGYLEAFYSTADKCGYAVEPPAILNACDFGVPQNRNRVFILGRRRDVKPVPVWPPAPTHFSPLSREVMVEGRRPWNPARVVFDEPLRVDDPNAVHMNHSAELVEVFASTPVDGGSRHQSKRLLPCHQEHDGHRDVYGRIDPARPGPTMTTACINPSKGRFVHPRENHGITARHAARFQGFPEHFVFDGGLMAAGVQIGNAVPVGLGTAALSRVFDALDRESQGASAAESRFVAVG